MSLFRMTLMGVADTPPVPEYEMEAMIPLFFRAEPVVLLTNLQPNKFALINMCTLLPTYENDPFYVGRGISTVEYDSVDKVLTITQRPATTGSPINAALTVTPADVSSGNRWLSAAVSSINEATGRKVVAVKSGPNATVQKIFVDNDLPGQTWKYVGGQATLGATSSLQQFYQEVFTMGPIKAIEPYYAMGVMGYNSYVTAKVVADKANNTTASWQPTIASGETPFLLGVGVTADANANSTQVIRNILAKTIATTVAGLEDNTFLAIFVDVLNHVVGAYTYKFYNGTGSQYYFIPDAIANPDINQLLGNHLGLTVSITDKARICTLDFEKRLFVFLDSSIGGAIVLQYYEGSFVVRSNLIPIGGINQFTRICQIGDNERFAVFLKNVGDVVGILQVYKVNLTTPTIPWTPSNLYDYRVGNWYSSERLVDHYNVVANPYNTNTNIIPFSQVEMAVNRAPTQGFLGTSQGQGWHPASNSLDGTVAANNSTGFLMHPSGAPAPGAVRPYINLIYEFVQMAPGMWANVSTGKYYLEQTENEYGARFVFPDMTQPERGALFRPQGYEFHGAYELYYKDSMVFGEARHCFVCAGSSGVNGWEFGFLQENTESGRLYLQIYSGEGTGIYYSQSILFNQPMTTLSGTGNVYGFSIASDGSVMDEFEQIGTVLLFYLNGQLIESIILSGEVMDGSSDNLSFHAALYNVAPYTRYCVKGKIYEAIGVYGPQLLFDNERTLLNNYCQARMAH